MDEQFFVYNAAISGMSGMSAMAGGVAGPPDFKWTYSGTGATKTYYFTVDSGVEYTLIWGDGDSTTVTGTGSQQGTSHTYESGTFVGKFTTEDFTAVKTVYLFNVGITGDAPDPAKFTKLTSYKVTSNSGLDGNIPTFENNSLLTTLQLTSCSLTGSMSSLSHMTSLASLYIRDNEISGKFPDISGCSSLTMVDADTNDFTAYAGSAIPSSVTTFDLWGAAIASSNEIDSILAKLDTAGGSSGTVDLRSGTNAAPSSAGLTSKSNLEGKGWTVRVNS